MPSYLPLCCVQLHLYVSGLLISRRDGEVRLAALQAVISSKAPLASSHNLTLLLYQLAKEKQSDNQLALLRALPSTAVDKVTELCSLLVSSSLKQLLLLYFTVTL